MRITEYIKDEETLFTLLCKSADQSFRTIPILVGMVDNNKTRQLFDRFFHRDDVKNLIYLDAGVEAVFDKLEFEYTEEENEEVLRSGFGGQVVCGVKMDGNVLLEPVGRLYQNILDDARSSFPDESCGDYIVNNPQRGMTNLTAALLTATYMNNLFHSGRIYTHAVNFNAAFGGVRPTFIQEDVIEHYKQLNKLETS